MAVEEVLCDPSWFPNGIALDDLRSGHRTWTDHESATLQSDAWPVAGFWAAPDFYNKVWRKLVCESVIAVQYIHEAWAGSGALLFISVDADAYTRAKARFWEAYVEGKVFSSLKAMGWSTSKELRTKGFNNAVPTVETLEQGFRGCSQVAGVPSEPCWSKGGKYLGGWIREDVWLMAMLLSNRYMRDVVVAAFHAILVTEHVSGLDSCVANQSDCLSILSTKKTAAGTSWVVASAALHHATGNRALLSDFTPEQGRFFVHAGEAGAAPMCVLGRGNVVTDDVVLADVWYVPGLTANLVSVSQLAELDCIVGFGRGKCCIRSSADGTVLGEARARERGMFAVEFLKVPLSM